MLVVLPLLLPAAAAGGLADGLHERAANTVQEVEVENYVTTKYINTTNLDHGTFAHNFFAS